MTVVQVFPFTYQSQDITFATWITLFTLCLAPLVAHIVAGVPQPSFLCSHSPKWHELICHYNPTSIIWRYAMITDRRIRAKSWDREDIAASNALFWTSRGWDGSEIMVTAGLPYCTRLPDHPRVTIFSQEMIKTIIVTLQGIQALIPLLSGLSTSRASDSFVQWMAVDTIFFPLSILGLFRLCCAAWLTEDFLYGTSQVVGLGPTPASSAVETRTSFENLLGEPLPPDAAPSRFRPTAFWASMVFRAVYLLPILAMSTTCILYLGPWTAKDITSPTSNGLTMTSFLLALSYLLFTSTTAIVCAYYFARGHTTTVIPCISSLWYKAYTVVVIGLGISLIVISCLETRKTPCGIYTSGSGEVADIDACLDENTTVVPVGPGKSHFGLVSTRRDHRDGNGTSLAPHQSWVLNFTGTCLGVVDDTPTQLVRCLHADKA
ncbi:hypothetical protein DL764_005869 [Monosporascus ibericus]|uniref:Uncharacterized protein n=1 Tax=Monosporascus ibericus TaxID=155417 RepID=A0A4Q4T926_9PEZI|nr:hypothetical protein DL764_005869 [Monosporascus ibericus]